MAATQTWRTSRTDAVGGRAATAGRSGRRSHRAGRRLWALLNAQALLNGTSGPPDTAALAEDDRWRMAGRRLN